MGLRLLPIFILAILGSAALNAEDKEALIQRYENHEVRRLSFWKSWRNKTMLERIQVAPPEVLEYIDLDNRIYGYEGTPAAPDLKGDFTEDLHRAIAELPAQVHLQTKDHLIGIFLMKGLGSTGYCEGILQDGQYRGGFVVLDVEVLQQRTANVWASWRISSAFQPSEGGEALELELAPKEKDDRTLAIRFILLHEFAHIVGPAHGLQPADFRADPSQHPFTSISWKEVSRSVHDQHFPLRPGIAYYRFDRSKLTMGHAAMILNDLVNTDFPSLYAATSPWDDFAECYAIYVHQHLLGGTYRLTWKGAKDRVTVIDAPFQGKRMKRKKLLLDDLFAAPSP